MEGKRPGDAERMEEKTKQHIKVKIERQYGRFMRA